MLTGDSPATARAIAAQAGLLDGGDVLTGTDIAALQNGDLDRRLERAAVIARVTPLDKLRIVESLQHHGHTVAMTGDGVNDAPALRLANVGVAMGRGRTEVARQAADVVLADVALGTGSLPQARAVAFAGIVTTQLAQTLDAGRTGDGLTRPVVAAVAAWGGLLVAALTVPALRDLLLLAAPTPLGWVLIGAGGPVAILLSRALGARDAAAPAPALPVPALLRLRPAPRPA